MKQNERTTKRYARFLLEAGFDKKLIPLLVGTLVDEIRTLENKTLKQHPRMSRKEAQERVRDYLGSREGIMDYLHKKHGIIRHARSRYPKEVAADPLFIIYKMENAQREREFTLQRLSNATRTANTPRRRTRRR